MYLKKKNYHYAIQMYVLWSKAAHRYIIYIIDIMQLPNTSTM